MTDICPNCKRVNPETVEICTDCGQELPEEATIQYVAGLLAPPALVSLGLAVGFYFSVVPGWMYWFCQGMMVMGTVMLVRTDDHIAALRAHV